MQLPPAVHLPPIVLPEVAELPFYAHWDFWVSFFTLLLVIATLLLVLETRKMRQGSDEGVKTMERHAGASASAARQSAEAAISIARANETMAYTGQRAWVTVARYTLGDLDPSPLMPFKKQLIIEFRNGGKTPAVSVIIRCNRILLTDFPKQMPPLQDFKEEYEGASVLGPEGVTNFQPDNLEFAPEQSDLIKRGEKKLFVFGEVTYSDILKAEPHVTEFCFVYDPKVSLFAYYAKHNSVS